MAGVIRRFIAQKIKHPITRKWIETMYMTDDGAGNDIKIYWHGIPADNKVIELNHLSDDTLSGIQSAVKQGITLNDLGGTVNSTQIKDGSVTTDDIGDGEVKTKNLDRKAVKTVNLDDGAVTKDKLDSGAVTESKLDNNLKTTLQGTVNEGILKLPFTTT